MRPPAPGEAARDTAALSIAMRPQVPTIGDGVAWFAAVALSPVYMLIGALLGARLLGLAPWGGAGVALCAVLAATGAWLRHRRRRLPRPPALVTDTALVVTPRGRRQPVTIPFTEMRYLSHVPGETLTLGRDMDALELRADDFVAPDALAAIELAIRRAVASLPDGRERYATMQANQRLTRLLGARSVPVTWTLLGVNGFMFVIELLIGALDDPRALVRAGANVPALVHEGQWWRLVTAGFLHGSVMHILLNGMALMSVGALLEKLVGPLRFLLIALVAGIAGNAASAWFGGGLMSVGASSCVFGLLGALLAVQLGKQSSLPPQLIVSRRQWVYLLGVNALISFLPGIDLSAHAGGFAAGAVLGALFVPGLDIRRPREPLPLRLAAAALVLVCTVAFAHALHRAQQADALGDMRHAYGAHGATARWTQHALPGFSLQLPAAPVVSRQGDYQAGKLVVRNPQPPSGFFVAVEWAGGDASRESLLAGERAFADALHIEAAPRFGTTPGPDGKPVDTLRLEVDGAPLRIARLPCGQRYIQVAAYGDVSIDALFARVLGSVQCTPLPAEEAMSRWIVPLYLDLPGWRAAASAPGRLALSDGSSTLLALRHGVALDGKELAVLLKSTGADVTLTPSTDGRVRYAGRWQDQPVAGWAAQVGCPGGSVVLLAFSPDAARAEALAERIDVAARCARPEDTPQTWPTAPPR